MTVRRPVLLVIVAAAVVAAVPFVNPYRTVRPPAGTVVESGGPAFDAIRTDEIQSVLPQDAIPALIKPAYLSVAQASDINDKEEVIGPGRASALT